MKLLSCRELAEQIGRSCGWVSAAKKRGMPFFCGRITFSKAVRWMEKNPKFTVTLVYGPKAKRKAACEKLQAQADEEGKK